MTPEGKTTAQTDYNATNSNTADNHSDNIIMGY